MMRNSALKRLTALILTLTLVLSVFPSALAEEIGTGGSTPPLAETPVSDADIPEEEPELTVEEPEPAVEEPEPAVEEPEAPAETPEAPAEETEASVEEAEPIDEPAELPFGLAGMPDGFALSDEQLEDKRVMAERKVAEETAALTAGVDYRENEIMFWAETLEYAEEVAAAYNGELTLYAEKIAVVRLTEITTVQALSAAADINVALPAVDANHIITVWPEESDGPTAASEKITASSFNAPSKQSWEDYRNSDPFLANPSAATYQWQHDAVNSYEAWGVTHGERNIKVAVLDTGVRETHEDLTGHTTVVSMTDITGVSDTDTSGHGTNVAGIIAAQMGNNKGGSGIAPGVSILSLCVIPGGSGDDASIAAGVNRAVNNGADIINMSLGGDFYNSTFDQAIQNAYARGVTVIAAMGNDGSNVLHYPAAYNNVIAVSAVNSDGVRASFSSYGAWADIAAPGVNIYSCYKDSDDSYRFMSGTSQATPVVAGAAALYMSKVGHVSPDAMLAILKKSVNRAGSSQIGAGIVDASKLFSGDKTKPIISVIDDMGRPVTNLKTAVPYDSEFTVGRGLNASNDEMIIYTVNGKNPTVKNGVVTEGEEYTGGVSLDAFAGKRVTIKAACISGMGVISGVASVSLTVSANPTITRVDITGARTLVAGRSETFAAVVKPDNALQKVAWSIDSKPNAPKASISAAGVLRTAATDSGTVTIRAASAADPTVFKTFNVIINQGQKLVTKIELSAPKISCEYKDANHKDDANITVVRLTLADKTVIDDPTAIGQYDFRWTTSNAKVSRIKSVGAVSAVFESMGKGTATITCRVLDGSAKTARCTVTVSQMPTSVTLTGQQGISPGKTATYKTTVLPAAANNKKLIWTVGDVHGNPISGVSISTAGRVTVAKTVPYDTDIYITAACAADPTVYAAAQAKVVAPASSVVITTLDSRAVYSRTGVMTGATIFSTNTPGGIAENVIDLNAALNSLGVNPTDILWKSGNVKVANVDANGNVTAVGRGVAGKAVITASANDGSGKKASVTITVVNPVSKLTITPKTSGVLSLKNSATNETEFVNFAAIGKSVTNKLTYGDAYGNPTVKKATWSLNVYEINSSNQVVDDWTSYFAANKKITLSSSGTLNVKSTAIQEWNRISYTFVAVVTATAADGSGVSAEQQFYLTPLITRMTAPRTATVYAPGGIYIPFSADTYFPSCFTVTSSNPKIAGSLGTFYSGGLYVEVIGHQRGTARITIKATDGSNKSCSITVKVI